MNFDNEQLSDKDFQKIEIVEAALDTIIVDMVGVRVVLLFIK